MKSKFLLIIVFLIMMIIPISFSVEFQATSWVHEANSLLNLPGGQGNLGYCSNSNNILTNISYQMCNFDGGLFAPVGADFNGDEIPDVVVVNTNSLKIYDQDCALLYDQTLNDTPQAMPVIVNYDGDAYQEVIIMTSTELQAWQYDGNESLEVTWSIDYNASLNVIDMNKIDCTRSTWVAPETKGCILMKQAQRDIWVYYHNNQSFIKRTNELPDAQLN